MASRTTRITIFLFICASLDHALDRPRGGAQVDASEVVVVERADAIVASARQTRLRVGDFDAVGDAGLVAALGLR